MILRALQSWPSFVRSALFLLVRDCHRMRALHEVSRFPARLERSSADPALIAEVRARLPIDPWDG
jgi:uncharacterized membrane protein